MARKRPPVSSTIKKNRPAATSRRKTPAKRVLTASKVFKKNVPYQLANSVNTMLPKQRIMSFKYCTRISLHPPPTVSAATAATPIAGRPSDMTCHTFLMNSLFDPDYSSSAITTANNINDAAGSPDHQPFGFDEVSQYYSSFTVQNCKATAKFSSSSDGCSVIPDPGRTPNTAAAGAPHNGNGAASLVVNAAAVYVGCYASDESTMTQMSLNKFRETDVGTYKYHGPQKTSQTIDYANFSLAQQPIMKGNATHLTAKRGDWMHTGTANPTTAKYLHVWVSPATLGNGRATPSMDVEVELVYKALLGDRIGHIPQS